jgi:signal transduction histidine kinase
VILGDLSWMGSIVVGNVAELGLGAAIGDAVRSRRAYIAAIEERAHRAERTREEEATRRVMEERLRIARELHDVLAHHIALINVQAGVASLVLVDKPDQARESLSHIRKAGRAALDELRTTVGLLRQPDSLDELSTEPAPGLDRLPDLIASFTASGLSVDPWIEGEAQDLPATIDLTAYRIVQEALTNVSKHAGDATASVRLTFAPSDLRIEVTDTGTGQNLAAPGTGHGLLGMRERALSVGGTFSAGPGRHGGFRVLAKLPVTSQVRKWCRP